VGQKFGSTDEVKRLVKRHSIETRRKLSFLRNDKQRIRVVCEGDVPNFRQGDGLSVDGPNGPNDGKSDANLKEDAMGSTSSKKTKGQRHEDKQHDMGGLKKHKKRIQKLLQVDCPWKLYISKIDPEETYIVKTYTPNHICLNSRQNSYLTSKFMSQEDWVMRQVESNPNVSIKSLQEEASRKYELKVSRMQAFRAKVHAAKVVQGDYKEQYSRLRDYLRELMTANPGTTAKIQVENEDTDGPNRIFKRVYICIGALKEGFKACGRELLGLDGAFMKGPYPGQILTAVGIDPNNGIYPLAYAVVEAENKNSWIWFLHNLQDDLDLPSNCNFTFISDRQKVCLC
jgi:hypothetical protein